MLCLPKPSRAAPQARSVPLRPAVNVHVRYVAPKGPRPLLKCASRSSLPLFLGIRCSRFFGSLPSKTYSYSFPGNYISLQPTYSLHAWCTRGWGRKSYFVTIVRLRATSSAESERVCFPARGYQEQAPGAFWPCKLLVCLLRTRPGKHTLVLKIWRLALAVHHTLCQ